MKFVTLKSLATGKAVAVNLETVTFMEELGKGEGTCLYFTASAREWLPVEEKPEEILALGYGVR